jgi:hypothetical protein
MDFTVNKFWKILLISILSSCLVQGYILAQEDEFEHFYSDTLSTQVDLFSVEDPMDITLMFDIKSYQRQKFKGEYMPVQLIYHVNDTLDIHKKVRVKARGEFRRKYCVLPPFWLNIKKAKVGNKYLEGTNKIKIVTRCINSKQYGQYLIKEYLTYKIYNEISPYSFRVRLIHMKYIDTGRKNKETSSWAFMIEPEEMMAERLGMTSIKSDHVSMHYTDTSSMDLVAVFMYMIGNADYSVAGRHNLKLIKHKDPFRPLPLLVPYDYDYAGVVNANYAIPGENLGISAVTERYFLGPCREDRYYLAAIEQICENKDKILQIVDSSPYLDSPNRKEMSRYLQEFFTEAGEPDRILGNFHRTCAEKP